MKTFLILLFFAATAQAAPNKCEAVFKSVFAAEPADLATTAANYYGRMVAQSGMDVPNKSQLEVIFGLRDRIKASGSGVAKLETTEEKDLISSITKRSWDVDSSMTMSQFENDVAMPAFFKLALSRALERHQNNRNVDVDELVQAAMVGLLAAIRTYDASSNFMFSTVAEKKMLKEFYEVGRQSSAGMPLSSTSGRYRMLNQLLRIRSQLTHRQSRKPTDDEIVAEYRNRYTSEIPDSTLLGILERADFVRALNSQFLAEPKSSEAIGEGSPYNFDSLNIADSGAKESHDIYGTKLMEAKWAEALLSLQVRQRQFLSLYLGVEAKFEHGVYLLVDHDPMTPTEIGNAYGLQSGSVHYYLNRAIRALKHPARTGDMLER